MVRLILIDQFVDLASVSTHVRSFGELEEKNEYVALVKVVFKWMLCSNFSLLHIC